VNWDKFDEGIRQKVNFLAYSLLKFSKSSPAALKSTGQITEIFISARNQEFKFSKILKNFQNFIFLSV